MGWENLCISINYVRNSRVDIVVSIENEKAVMEALTAHGYCVTARNVRDDIVELRAV